MAIITADTLKVSADTTRVTADRGYDGLIRPGWPCALLGSDPPSVADRQSAPSAEDVAAQIAGILTPRGPAWGTDEAGDGRGAGPTMRGVWSALGAWVADLNFQDWRLATQALPSAIDPGLSLDDWEAELGLPDPCATGEGGDPGRIAAVRARFGAQGGQSPAYFICLAASIGYDIAIEEPTQFLVDVSELGPDPIEDFWFRVDEGELAPDSLVGGVLQPEGDGTPIESFRFVPIATEVESALDAVSDITCWKDWVVRVSTLAETWFHVDEGELAPDSLIGGALQPEGPGDPLEGFLPAADLECLLRRACPPHTRLIFNYAPG